LGELADERGLRDLLSLSKSAEERLHFGTDSKLDECVGGHGRNRVTTAAGRLFCAAKSVRRSVA